ncbi:MAG TPA: anthranilate phosphoribosyltransferase [Mycobacteriales bacterium]|jgi:anthranilate phosphoribosyltransferase|nr:anthranilate phosphoribosyltransferase [Mycobacteriales bacterium]
MTRWPDLLTALLRGESLAEDQTTWAMRQIMAGEASPAQVAGFVVALRAKGESSEEVAGLASVMLELAASVLLPEGLRAVDTCGTGGDRANTVNISTMAALVLAGCGAQVVKHGNRSASSLCGSADLLEEMGVAIDLPPAGVAACVAAGAPAFCFAPVFHPSMRHTAAPRRELGVPTVFNVLGPLTNPARPAAQVVGVADGRLAAVMAGVFARRGVDAIVVRGDDGLDELTTSTTSRAWWVRGQDVVERVVDPTVFGLQAGDLVGGDAAHNAKVCRDLLAGKPGPVRDAVLLNAAAGLVAWRPGQGSLDDQLAEALTQGAISIDEGDAAAALDRWITSSQAARSA